MKLGEKQKLTVVKIVEFGIYTRGMKRESCFRGNRFRQESGRGMNWKFSYTKTPRTG